MSVTLPRSQPAGPAGPARRFYPARLIALLALALLLAACGGAATPTVTPIPATPTPTPLSEPLPTVATQPPFGVSDRPFRLVLLTPSARESALGNLEAFLTGRTGQAFAVQTSEAGADVIDALCSDAPMAAWVDGLTLLMALDRGCAEPALQIRRGRGNAASNGVRADLIASAEARITSVTGFRDEVFCRLGPDSVETWLLPVMFMRAEGEFDPFRDLADVREVPDAASMAREVGNAQCVGALPAGMLRNVSVPGLNVREAVDVIATTPMLPHGGLVFSSRMPPALAEQVAALFREEPDSLEGLVDATALVDASASTFAAALNMLHQAGISAALGAP
ncbi:MAG: PhnD/SsuA/transferrin family substrate-binding protein [Anaerolineae bacterium]|nr:PhnD/SsuA/transferrin family substrate-binding protein [Anaerolineae bacterium]